MAVFSPIFLSLYSMEIRFDFMKLSALIYSLNLILKENLNKTKYLHFDKAFLIPWHAIFK